MRSEMITEHVGTLEGSANLVQAGLTGNAVSSKDEPPEKWSYDITIRLADVAPPSVALLDDLYYEGKKLALSLGNEPLSIPIRQGMLALSRDAERLTFYAVTVDFGSLDTNIIAAPGLEIDLPAVPVQAPPPKDYTNPQ